MDMLIIKENKNAFPRWWLAILLSPLSPHRGLKPAFCFRLLKNFFTFNRPQRFLMIEHSQYIFLLSSLISLNVWSSYLMNHLKYHGFRAIAGNLLCYDLGLSHICSTARIRRPYPPEIDRNVRWPQSFWGGLRYKMHRVPNQTHRAGSGDQPAPVSP